METLVVANRAWAKQASALILTIALGYKNIDDQKPEKGRKEISEFVFENSF